MEQRIGSNSQPLDVAAVDPAFIPGLTPTVSAEPKSTAEPEGAAEPEKAAEAADEASSEDKTSEEAPAGEAAEEPSPAKDPAKESSKASAKDSDEAEEEPAEEADDEADSEGLDSEGLDSESPDSESPDSEGPDSEGPAFEASDRRASIVADRRGVRLRLDDQEAEFRWDEIGAVETESPRFGKRFTITVHTPDRRWYPIEIEASARSRFKEWETKLDEVLDAYFQE
ncbi:hypothetical protein ACFYS7_21340 [Streptomyces avermitilis]|uniref:hypothetical protein n=1 Tax=Streptomyces avermitilis TaxID=33903 RepID=UPI0033B1E7FA